MFSNNDPPEKVAHPSLRFYKKEAVRGLGHQSNEKACRGKDLTTPATARSVSDRPDYCSLEGKNENIISCNCFPRSYLVWFGCLDVNSCGGGRRYFCFWRSHAPSWRCLFLCLLHVVRQMPLDDDRSSPYFPSLEALKTLTAHREIFRNRPVFHLVGKTRSTT